MAFQLATSWLDRNNRNRLMQLCNRLGLYKLRTCTSSHKCVLCEEDITLNQTYRDGGYGRRAHDQCVTIAVRFLDALNEAKKRAVERCLDA